ncbi:MAG: class II glutamine amidotransferase [Pseudomonadota bacterium]
MCRWVAYTGTPIFLDSLVSTPVHSLIRQSLHANEAKVETNGDGFGLGWYGHHAEPGIYRDILPAWSDDNLRSLCQQIQSRLFFAHVRASTGTATSRQNCHPFAIGKWLFMHNGQIGGYASLRRKIEARIPDEIYHYRLGATDSEAMFMILFAHGLDSDPVCAVAQTLSEIDALRRASGIDEALRFTATLSDGETIYAFRYATDKFAPSLYYRCDAPRSCTIVSEPPDLEHDSWIEVPRRHLLIARPGKAATLQPFELDGGSGS